MGTPVNTTTEKRIAQLEEELRRLKSRLAEQNMLKEQLRQAQKMEAIAVLSSGVAHDFNNILQSILSRIQLIILEEGRDPSYGPFTEILGAIERGAELAKQFLMYGVKRETHFAPLDINNNVRDIHRLIRRTFPKTIHIELELSHDLKKIYADAGQIDQVLMNLCINARDAMPNGGKLFLKTKNTYLDQSNDFHFSNNPPYEHVRFTISDTGFGIPQEVSENIFEPFFTTKKHGKGTGLGLSMVHSIVKGHKGFINFASHVGEGTTFNIHFPVLNPAHMGPNMEESDDRIGNPNGNEAILLVDDDQNISMLGKTMLEKYGYTVTTANTGEEAIQLYSPKAFALVVLDLDMPGMGGIECLQRIQTLNRKAKVIAISGYSSEEQLEVTLKTGAKAFIAKPFGMEDFIGRVRNVLDGR